MTVSDSDTQAVSANQTPAITFYGKMLTFSRLQLSTDDLAAIDAHLANMLSNKDSDIPVIIDSDVEQDLAALIDLLWSWGLQPIGVVKGLLESQARSQRLAIFPADGKRIERIVPTKKAATQISHSIADSQSTTGNNDSDKENQTAIGNDISNLSSDTTSTTNTSPPSTQTTLSSAPIETLVSAEHITSLIYDQVLRSGQSLNHVGGDLILTNSVNSGAEAITDNNLHVYARAQGRLVAGATGDQDARIFCQVFNPSLVSVAGTYCLRDNIPEELIDKPVQVRFVEGEGLVFTVMDTV